MDDYITLHYYFVVKKLPVICIIIECLTFRNRFPDPFEVVCEDEDTPISYHVDKKDCTKYYLCQGKVNVLLRPFSWTAGSVNSLLFS